MKTLVLAVIGAHGAGKTSFIQSVVKCIPTHLPQSPTVIKATKLALQTGGTPPDVEEVCMYPCNMSNGDTPFMLVDTPGLSLRSCPDRDTIRFIKARLNGAGIPLHGAIYLQRIFDTSRADYALLNLRAFYEACRSDEFEHLVVATTFWDAVSEDMASAREAYFLAELDPLVFSTQIEHETARLYNNAESSVALLRTIRDVEAREVAEVQAAEDYGSSEEHRSVTAGPASERHGSERQRCGTGVTSGPLVEMASETSHEEMAGGDGIVRARRRYGLYFDMQRDIIHTETGSISPGSISKSKERCGNACRCCLM